jgi:hypothetical protein
MGTNIDPPRYETPIVRWWEREPLVPVVPESPGADEEREPSDVSDNDSVVNDSSRKR